MGTAQCPSVESLNRMISPNNGRIDANKANGILMSAMAGQLMYTLTKLKKSVTKK